MNTKTLVLSYKPYYLYVILVLIFIALVFSIYWLFDFVNTLINTIEVLKQDVLLLQMSIETLSTFVHNKIENDNLLLDEAKDVLIGQVFHYTALLIGIAVFFYLYYPLIPFLGQSSPIYGIKILNCKLYSFLVFNFPLIENPFDFSNAITGNVYKIIIDTSINNCIVLTNTNAKGNGDHLHYSLAAEYIYTDVTLEQIIDSLYVASVISNNFHTIEIIFK